jgi:hypothetical protein
MVNDSININKTTTTTSHFKSLNAKKKKKNDIWCAGMGQAQKYGGWN